MKVNRNLLAISCVALLLAAIAIMLTGTGKDHDVVKILSGLDPHNGDANALQLAKLAVRELGTNIEPVIFRELTLEEDSVNKLFGSIRRRRRCALIALEEQQNVILSYLPRLEALARSDRESQFEGAVQGLRFCGNDGAQALVNLLPLARPAKRDLILSTLSGMFLARGPTAVLLNSIHSTTNSSALEFAVVLGSAITDTNYICNVIAQHRACSNRWCSQAVEMLSKSLCATNHD
jgi:hypothetical protein